MHITWSQTFDYLYGNRVAIGSACMLAITAAVKTAPPATNIWLKWLNDFFHQLLNISQPERPTSPK